MTQLSDIKISQAGKDYTFLASNPQSGDTQAMWTYLPSGASRNEAVRLQNLVRRTGSGTASKTTLTMIMPVYTTNAAGVRTKAYQIPVRMEVTLPDAVTDSVAVSAFDQFIQLLQNSNIRNTFVNSSQVI